MLVQWNNEVTLGDIVTFLGVLFVGIALLFTTIEIRQNARTQKAGFLLDLTERYFRDDEMRKFFYRLDYGKWNFVEPGHEPGDEPGFALSDEERWLDGSIYIFDIIGRMVKMRVITKKELEIISFQASRVLHNPEVEKYFIWLDNEYQKVGRPTPAHPDARFLSDFIR